MISVGLVNNQLALLPEIKSEVFFLSLWSMSLCAGPKLLRLQRPWVCLKVKYGMLPAVFFLFRIALAVYCPLSSWKHFFTITSVSMKNTLGFVMSIVLNL